MELKLRCELIAGTGRGGEDVVLYTDLRLSVGDVTPLRADELLVEDLRTLGDQVDAFLDKQAADYLADDEEGVFPEPNDDCLDSPENEDAVWVTDTRVFTGRSDQYRQQVILTRAEVRAKLVGGEACNPANWRYSRRYGTNHGEWRFTVTLGREGNAE